MVDGQEYTPVTEFVPTTLKEMLLYKLDRTIAIVGIILLGAWALLLAKVDVNAFNITTTCVGVLGGYVGGRTGK